MDFTQACAKDLGVFAGTGLGKSRAAIYAEVEERTEALASAVAGFPEEEGSEAEQAHYALRRVKPARQIPHW